METEINQIYNEEYLSIAKIGNLIIGIDIPQIVIINLIDRADRNINIIQEMTKWKLPFSFYYAERAVNPVRGCLESHINIIKWAKQNNYKQVCIFEDDVIIRKSLEEIENIPENYDMLYLGGLCTEMHYKLNDWCKGRIYCNHAYIIKDTVFDFIIEHGWVYDYELDRFYTEQIHANKNAYVTYFQYVIQYENFSDIEGRRKWNNYNWPAPGEMFYIP
jgi:GR25 family glycosyltransferase involved in LPS biosynthesis